MKAASEILAEHGLDAPLDVIADRAGVGRATLYRNFADRAELALAVLGAEMERLGQQTRARADDPAAFFWFIEELAEIMVRNAGVSAVARQMSGTDALAPLREKLIDAGADPLERARAAGLIRADMVADDLRLMAAMLALGFGVSEADRRARSLRARQLILDGVRVRPGADDLGGGATPL